MAKQGSENFGMLLVRSIDRSSDKSVDMLDILILTQSRVHEAYLKRVVRPRHKDLRSCLGSLANANLVQIINDGRNKKCYKNTSFGQQFLDDNLRKLVSEGFGREGSDRPAVSVIIPAFNEEGSLRAVIQRTHEVLRSLEIPYEIIVIDDGSTDNTSKVAYKSKVTLIENGLNGGKGHALQLGFQRARGSFIITMDADGSHRPEEISRLLYPLLSRNLDVHVVIGSRFVGEMEDGSITKLHLIGNRILDLATRLLTGKRVSDTQSGFRAYRREVVEKMALQSLGFEIEAEMIVKALKEGWTPLEVPITCRKREYGRTRIRPFRDGFKILGTVVRASLAF